MEKKEGWRQEVMRERAIGIDYRRTLVEGHREARDSPPQEMAGVP